MRKFSKIIDPIGFFSLEKLTENRYFVICYPPFFTYSTRLRGDQSALDCQTKRGRRAQRPSESVRRTPRPQIGAVRRPVGGRQVASVDGPSQLHHGRGALHRTAERRECFLTLFCFLEIPKSDFIRLRWSIAHCNIIVVLY